MGLNFGSSHQVNVGYIIQLDFGNLAGFANEVTIIASIESGRTVDIFGSNNPVSSSAYGTLEASYTGGTTTHSFVFRIIDYRYQWITVTGSNVFLSNGLTADYTGTPSSVPEPSTLLLLGSGLLGLVGYGRKRMKK